MNKEFWEQVLKEYEAGLLKDPKEIYLCKQSSTFDDAYDAWFGGNAEIRNLAKKFLIKHPQYSFIVKTAVLFVSNDMEKQDVEKIKIRQHFLKWAVENEDK